MTRTLLSLGPPYIGANGKAGTLLLTRGKAQAHGIGRRFAALDSLRMPRRENLGNHEPHPITLGCAPLRFRQPTNFDARLARLIT
jgi:hypothetical protein